MLKHKKKIQKKKLEEEESQKTLTMDMTLSEIRSTLSELYGDTVVSMSITIPITLYSRIATLITFFEQNRSAVISWLMHQGSIREMEHRARNGQ